MRAINKIQIKIYLLAIFFGIAMLISNGVKANYGLESIASILEAQHPSFSMSFSKNILDFFDAEIDWEDSKKHVEGDFASGSFYVFDDNLTVDQLQNLFKKQGYHFIKIEDKENKNDELVMFVNKKGKQVEEAHFIVQNDNSLVVISIYGDIRIKDKK